MAIKILKIFTLSLLLLSFFTITAQSAPKKFVVVIDAGHGGHDPGAVGKKAKEKTINLNTALKLGKLIEQNCGDVKVVYTRKTDVFIPLNQRAQIANNAKADLFISIHTNALPKGKIVSGAETYTLGMARAGENLEVAKKENSVILMENGYKETYKGFNPNSSESYIIFEFMQDKNMNQSINFAKKIQQQFKKAGRVDKGVHQAGFLVLRETAMPSVLVELGYISTPQEENFLNTSAGIDKMAKSIYNAFISYKSGQNTSAPAQPSKASAPVVAESAAAENDDVVELHPIRDASHVARNGNQQTKASNAKEPVAKKEAAPAKAVEKPANKTAEKAPAKTAEKAPVKTTGKAPAKTAVKPTAKVEEKATAKTEEKAKSETSKASPSDTPVFKIQILTSPSKLNANDKQFKGLKGVDFYRESSKYKYTYGASTDYNEMLRKKKEITAKFSDCFIVAFKNGEKMDVNEAIRIFKNKK